MPLKAKQVLVLIIVVAFTFIFMYGMPRCLSLSSVSTMVPGAPPGASIMVYGSKTCPWCVKQEEYFTKKGVAYEFIDCTAGECPEFVQGFPTLVVDGKVMSGYTEL
jgi:glutaredoxin